jgi:chloramphenicol 3-O-phosphotransferase
LTAILLTGACAAGKSTVADLLARRFDRAVHVRGDLFRRMIVSGRVTWHPTDAEEADRQRRLRHAIMADVVDAYADAGFVAVAQDVILGDELEPVLARIRTRPLHLVVLAPRMDVLAARESARAKDAYDANVVTPEVLDRELRERTPRVGLWLDTSEQSPEETAEEIVARLDEGRLALPE